VTCRYVISNAAERDLRRISRPDLERIFAALDLLVGDPPRGDVRKLAGRDNEYRLRVGDWRVRFLYDTEEGPADRTRRPAGCPDLLQRIYGEEQHRGLLRQDAQDRAYLLPSTRERLCSNSSNVRGQSPRSSRDSARSASSFPAVWQPGQ
jgi:mRNA interferase RelE/StbE